MVAEGTLINLEYLRLLINPIMVTKNVWSIQFKNRKTYWILGTDPIE
jgi:hypothetical protein